jgi:cellulose synthase/poly-beta-1,6-N-acetylglucosamine synthase-like glycosyltransferase
LTALGRVLFWGSAAVLAYTFVLFPLLVVVRGVLRPRPPREGSSLPRVSVVMAAHNEAVGIAAKLENLLTTDYPPEQREVIVASDGSDDGTNEIVRGFEARGVRLLELPRVGKAAVLDAGVAAASGEVLVFTDANSMFAPNALRELVGPFADDAVGGVAGNQVYRDGGDEPGSEAGERAYWGFDRLLKEHESRAGNTISATGAIYSIRRHFYRPIPRGVNDDFYLSLGVIEQGGRLVFARRAIAYEPVGSSLEIEYRRKVRILSRAMQCVVVLRGLVDVKRYGFYSIQLISHKILRWAVFIPVTGMTIASLLLWREKGIYRVAALAQLGAYGAAGLGVVLRDTRVGASKVLSVPAYFVMSNAAAAVAAANLVRGKAIDRWTPSRNEARRTGRGE